MVAPFSLLLGPHNARIQPEADLFQQAISTQSLCSCVRAHAMSVPATMMSHVSFLSLQDIPGHIGKTGKAGKQIGKAGKKASKVRCSCCAQRCAQHCAQLLQHAHKACIAALAIVFGQRTSLLLFTASCKTYTLQHARPRSPCSL